MEDSRRGEFLRFLRKPINFRPILFCALSFAAGIFFFGKFGADKVKASSLAIIAVLAVILVALPFCVKSRFKTYLITSAFCLIFCSLGLFSANVSLNSFEKGAFESGDYYVSGEVEFVREYDNNARFVTLKKCVYNGKKGGKLYIKYFPKKVKKYDLVNVICSASPCDEYSGDGLSSNVFYGETMIASGATFCEVADRSKSLCSRFAKFTDDILSDGSDEEEFAVARSLIRGDTDKMGENIEAYRMSGVAHVFAVSGMHVGLVFAALSLVFRFIPVKKIIKSLIISVVLFFYAYLCGMTASSVRAAVMCSVAAMASSLGEKRDRINSIAIALFIVLAINPFDLFSAGFVLSFAVSFAIILLVAPIKEIFSFAPKRIGDTLSVLFAANSVSAPLSVMYFGYFPLVSFVTNIVVLPLVSVTFYSLWIGLIVSAILPVNRLIALFIPSNLIKLMSGLCNVFANFPLCITVFPALFAAVYFVALIVASDFINGRRKTKIYSAVFAVVSVIVATLASL